MKSEEELNENLLDNGFSGLVKTFGGSTKIISIIVIIIVIFLVYKFIIKRRK